MEQCISCGKSADNWKLARHEDIYLGNDENCFSGTLPEFNPTCHACLKSVDSDNIVES